jgi:HK97 gp10 family phage protein
MTDIDRLAREITNAVRNYTEDVTNAIDKKLDEKAQDIRNDADRDAPRRKGKYAKGFRVTKKESNGKSKRVIWNKKYSRLVHLQEFGHAKRNGGRVPGRPHLRPAYDRHASALMNDIKRIIRNGG